MVDSKKRNSQKRLREIRDTRSLRLRERPNRIYELTKGRGWKYADVAERVTTLIKANPPVHEVTINKLATGGIGLTQDWMQRLGTVFGVDPAEIIAAPIASGLRRVRVRGQLQAGVWSESHEWPEDQHIDVMVTDDPDLRDVFLYGGEVRGQSMNRRYREGSIIVLSKLQQRPGEIIEGGRYHVRRTRVDGTTEETIKTLIRDGQNRYWLQPESTEPEFQAVPLDGTDGETVELIGRVRFVVSRED